MTRSTHGSAAGLLMTTAGTVLGLLAVYAATPLSGRGQVWGALVGFGAMGAAISVLVRRVHTVLHAERPVAEAIAAIAVTFTLIVLGSAATYFVLASQSGQFRGLETKVDAVYFTVVVMSTVGFGDIVPVGQAARLATTLHIVLTFSFLGGSLRLVTWAARRRLGDR